MLELVAISGICEAYRRVSGTYEYEERLKDEAKRELMANAQLESPRFGLGGPIASLLSGGLVGTGLSRLERRSRCHGCWILSALTASAIFKYSSSRQRSNAASREYRFIFDLSAATLDRVLPVLMDRLRNAGLAPVFVIDELDKVENLQERILGMVHFLKKLVAESAFFCFLTDRTYFEHVLSRGSTLAFPVEHTYYTHRLFVAYT